jgi:DNA-binding transcriptional LysR family regulator
MVKLNHLENFVSSVKAGSLTTASKNLYISQPALSKQLTLLEKELNCELFNRKTTGIELTEAGSHLYSRISVILEDINKLTNEMEKYSNRNSIRIGAIPNIGNYLLPPIINKLRECYDVELLFKDTTKELIDLMESEHIQFAFTQDTPENRNYVIKELFWESYDAIISSSSPLAQKREITLQELLESGLILYKHPCDERSYFEKYCKTKKVSFSLVKELTDSESVIPFVESGLGGSIMPRHALQESGKINSRLTSVKIIDKGSLQRRVDLLYKPSMKSISKHILDIYNNVNRFQLSDMKTTTAI